jgi:hypothetical protein
MILLNQLRSDIMLASNHMLLTGAVHLLDGVPSQKVLRKLCFLTSLVKIKKPRTFWSAACDYQYNLLLPLGSDFERSSKPEYKLTPNISLDPVFPSRNSHNN